MKISHSDKIIFPSISLTKSGLAEYYSRISDIIIPHLKDRPISMERFPEGINKKGFYQKEAPDYFPSWIDTAKISLREEGGTQRQVVINKKSTLVYLADQVMITPHVWLSTSERINKPDRIIFDFDPPGNADFKNIIEGAKNLKKIIDEIKMNSFVMTTGSEGLHVVVPIKENYKFNKTRDFAKKISGFMEERWPDKYTTEIRKSKRRGKIFIDYLRNAYGQTSVSPYSLRPLPGAPVATPIEWDELSRKNLNSQTYTIKNIFKRMGKIKDPWNNIMQKKTKISDTS